MISCGKEGFTSFGSLTTFSFTGFSAGAVFDATVVADFATGVMVFVAGVIFLAITLVAMISSP